MPLISAKCTNCGANLEVDNTKEAAVCPYCGSAYVVEKAINYYNTTNNITANVVNVYGANSADFVIRAGELVKYNGASTEVYIPSSVKIIGDNAFSGCNGLKKIIIPDSVIKIGFAAFSRCVGLVEIHIPNSVSEIGDFVFWDCTSLCVIVMSNSISRIPRSAFKGCKSLKSFDIPNGVTVIDSEAFYGCGSLSNVTIPNTVTKIGVSAFCCGLKSISIPDSVTEISAIAFGNSWDNTEYIEHIDASEDWKRKHYNVAKCLASYKPTTTAQSNGCYIATAVYGSYDCPQVWTLRRFRDDILAVSWYGRAFIRIYYAVSPTMVKLFGHTNWFKKLWRGKLDDMVEKLQQRGVESSPYCDREW